VKLQTGLKIESKRGQCMPAGETDGIKITESKKSSPVFFATFALL